MARPPRTRISLRRPQGRPSVGHVPEDNQPGVVLDPPVAAGADDHGPRVWGNVDVLTEVAERVEPAGALHVHPPEVLVAVGGISGGVERRGFPHPLLGDDPRAGPLPAMEVRQPQPDVVGHRIVDALDQPFVEGDPHERGHDRLGHGPGGMQCPPVGPPKYCSYTTPSSWSTRNDVLSVRRRNASKSPVPPSGDGPRSISSPPSRGLASPPVGMTRAGNRSWSPTSASIQIMALATAELS